MEDTCNFKDCTVAKKFKLKKPEECPNFVECWWTPNNGKEKDKPIIIKDCVNKRTFLMIQDLFNRLIGVQQSQEQMRNKYDQAQET